MKFRLLITGPLRSHDKATADEKQRFRRELHWQLRELWKEHPWFKDAWKSEDGDPASVERIADNFARNGFRWVPLLRNNGKVSCSLDVLILRRINPRYIMEGSDLDNRIKTLFDSLRMPSGAQELGGAKPEGDDDPFFCLLEDDRLIHNVNIVTDKLLVPACAGETASECVAVIHVHVKTSEGFEIAVFGPDLASL